MGALPTTILFFFEYRQSFVDVVSLRAQERVPGCQPPACRQAGGPDGEPGRQAFGSKEVTFDGKEARLVKR